MALFATTADAQATAPAKMVAPPDTFVVRTRHFIVAADTLTILGKNPQTNAPLKVRYLMTDSALRQIEPPKWGTHAQGAAGHLAQTGQELHG